MALVFTDDNIKSISKDIILIPFLINDPDNGFIAQKGKVLALQNNLLKTDEGQKVFSDFWISVVEKYHAELKAINATLRTNYSNSDLVKAGDQIAPHYPIDPAWTKLIPKVIPSNTGLPISTTNDSNELASVADVNTKLDLLLNGFTDGNTQILGVSITNNTFDFPTGSVSVGDRFIVDGNNHAVMGVITGVTVTPPNPPDAGGTVVTYTKIGGVNGSQVGTGRFRNYHTGFTDVERAHMGTKNYAHDVMLSIEDEIMAKVILWKNNLTAQKTPLETIGDLPPRKASNVTALNNVNNALGQLTTWEDTVVASFTGKFTNAGLATLLSVKANRQTQTTSRITEISSNLGALTQSADGSFTGSGVYYELFNTISLRTSKGSGTLFNYLQGGAALGFFDKKIEDATKQRDQYMQVFFVSKLTDSSTVGQISFEVEDASGFSVGDEVKIMDNDSGVLTRTINSISGNTIQLNLGASIAYNKAALARIVKQK